MNNQFYMKMAAENIRKNWKMYLPFIISCISTIMMTYIIIALSTNSGLSQIPGGDNLQTILFMGYIVLMIFSAVFLFYMHSFLMKNRKREFGVYNILGMDKKHIMKMFTFEIFYVAVLSMVIGLIAGTIFNKVCILLIRYMMNASVSLGFEFSLPSVGWTLGLFTIIFILILLVTIYQIRLANPIELLKSGNVGEKEPKTKVFLSVIGFALIGVGYYLALTIQSPIQGIQLAFLAVLAVMIGTYLLFTTGSIAILKMLKANKNYYYQSNHFIPVSGMIYRMKKNAVGLSNITILSVCVIVLFSIAGSIFITSDNTAKTQYPGNFISQVSLSDDMSDTGEEIKSEMSELIDRTGYETNTSVVDYSSHAYLTIPVFETSGGFEVTRDVFSIQGNQRPSSLYLTDQENYNQFSGDNISLDENEVYIHGVNETYNENTLTLMGQQFSVSEMSNMEEFSIGSETESEIGDIYYIIVPDMEILRQLEQQQQEILEDYSQSTIIFTQVDLGNEVSAEEEIEFGERMELNMENAGMDIDNIDTEVEAVGQMQALRSGVLFITLNLATLLLLMTVLIIYYKQTSEAYDDRERFSIMQKVGLDRSEIKKAIKSQILIVFFLPLIVTGLHILTFSLLMKKGMVLVMLNQVDLFPIAIICAFLIFTITYVVIYRITARVYYNIVK
ncbi:ABC transporter permease [Staphylococcus equorum]|uniref:ABC transporter permease n=1 Tax=Staphylococcus equorum TaxID=246432 RepID=UPI003F56B474